MDRIGVVGTSYRTTQIDRLAAAALPAEFSHQDLAELAGLAGFDELVYLGTCNRVEFYFRSDTPSDPVSTLFHLRHTLADLTDGASQLPADEELYMQRGEAAVRHIFRVAAALDSMMVGEAQIVGQIKQAHEVAHEAQLLGGVLDQAFHEAFHLAKRIRTETELTRRPVSLVTLVERKLTDHLAATSAPALILGAGEMAGQALRMIRAADPDRRILIANRSPEHAQELAHNDSGAYPLALDSLTLEPPRVGLVVAATSAHELLLTTEHVEAMRQRLPADEAMLLIDLAMPPNLDPAVSRLESVDLVGIEQMRAEADRNRTLRMKEMDRCDALVEHQIVILRRRLLDRSLSPVARTLHEAFSELAERAVQRALSKDLQHLGDEDRASVEKLTAELVKRLVQVPLRGLKGVAWDYSSGSLESFERSLTEGPPGSPEKENKT
ncbi:MAG: glutamyl-tRNA reductase [Acidobacteria bacterium]|nr:glutamyl-tRNA reductase [Acidobacteriota bacterium]